MQNYQALGKVKLSEWFKRFAEKECKGVSGIYYALSMAIAEDDELLDLAAYCSERQPMPNLLLAAVHYLLLKNPDTALGRYYPSINRNANGLVPFDLFKDYCLANSSAIKDILGTRIVQTNALNRTAHLMPTLSALFQENEPVNLVDIGASAGLNLNMDQYEYHYNDEWAFGESPVKIKSMIKEGALPDFQQMINIQEKIGIEQNPLDLKQAENALWLKALIWPDATARFDRLENAIQLAQNSTINLIKANTIAAFEAVILARASAIPLVIYHTHVLYQFTPNERSEFRNMLDRVSKVRDFYYLAVEGSSIFAKDYKEKGILVELTTYRNSKKETRLVAETTGHASWIKWSP